MDVSGEAFIKGQNRNQNIFRGTFKEFQKSTVYSGGILLNTKSYVWAPQFLMLDITGEYNPELNKDIYIVIPDRSEVRTMNRFDMRATFFSSKPVNLSVFLNLNNVYQNRENLANIRSNSKSWGGFFNYSNKILPHNISFTNTKWNQQEIQSNRNYYFDQTIFLANTSRSFTKYEDKHDLNYTHNEYLSKQWQFNTVNNFNEIRLNDDIYFDFKKNYHLQSLVSRDIQKGTYLNQKRIRVFENLFIKLPENLNLLGNYNFNNVLYDTVRTVQNNITGSLKHKLYQSLYTGIFYEYNNVKSAYFKEIRTKAGFDLRYVKKIPWQGYLNITYNFFRQHNSTIAEDVILQIIREEHVLTDGTIILLDKAYINFSTITVSDNTGTIIYQQGLDYLLIARNNYYEIQRVPGGLISNNSTVYVSYTANQPGTYKYDMNYHAANASITLWKNLFEIYYRLVKQDYIHLNKTDYITLNYITQNIVGTKLQYDFASGGFEYDYYNSSVVPYKMFRYYVDFQRNFNNRVNASLSANLRDYKMLDDSVRNKFYDVNSKVTYRIRSLTSVGISGSYIKQQINETDLNLILAGAEITTVYRKLYFTLGIDFYHRKYLNEEFRLKGIYLQISRKF